MTTTAKAVARPPTWAGIGTEVRGTMNAREALQKGGLDYEVGLRQALFEKNDGTTAPATNRMVIVRNDTEYPLGVVTTKYSMVQNREAFNFTDALLGEGVEYVSVGEINYGKRIWLQARVPEKVQILGDTIEPFLLFTTGHSGINGIMAALTPIRVVCENTLTMAIKDARGNPIRRVWSVNHTGNMEEKLKEAQRTLGLTRIYLEAMPEVAETMAGINLDKTEVEGIINELFPLPKEPSKRMADSIDQLRKTLWNIERTTPNLKKFRDTGWGMYNSVADMVTHWEPTHETKTFKERHFLSTFGDGSKLLEKAQTLVMQVRA